MRIEYAVQARSTGTGSSGRWVTFGSTPNRNWAEALLAEKQASNVHRRRPVAYRLMQREVTEWEPAAPRANDTNT